MHLIRTIFCLSVFSWAACGFAQGGMEELQQASSEGKYLYLFFYKDDSDTSLRLQKVFDQSVAKLEGHVRSVHIKTTDAAESEIVRKFDVKRAPMPLALVIAPNGAVMGGFPGTFTEEQLVSSLASMGAYKSLKALQERKLVFLCLQNSQTRDNDAALKGVYEFKQDARFSNASEIVLIDPSDKDEQRFLKQIGATIDPSQATTVMISPPADIVAQYVGPTTKNQIVADLTNATSGSCCPGGCCPGGCCPPKR